MKVIKLKDMKGGWYVGDFEPAAYKTSDFEVCYKKHPAGEKWDVHYHKHAIEVNYLVRGKMKIQETILNEGDIFILYPWEIADPTFLEDCEVVVVKSPSVPGDKIIVKGGQDA